MSSSGLIYAVIVGAWAAYLVPMWLRRQDELNEARPTERFSTAIRLLSGKAAMERRYAKDAERRATPDEEPDVPAASVAPDSDAADSRGPYDTSDGDDADGIAPDSAAEDAVDVRAFADPRTMVRVPASAGADQGPGVREEEAAKSAERNKRAKVLARRRRTTMVLFLAFSLGAIVAGVGGLAFLWAPAAPAALLSAYIVHLRTQERRRFTFTMDRRRAEEAAQRLRARRTGASAPVDATREPGPELASVPAPPSQRTATAGPDQAPEPPAATGAPGPAQSADRRALVEQTDHAEWVDQERAWGREQPEGEGWDPVPVPLPTYVSAPVAPRTARGVDLDAPDTWSSARSSTAGQTAGTGSDAGGGDPQSPSTPQAQRPSAAPDRGRTPLFDQYADEDRPRAVNE